MKTFIIKKLITKKGYYARERLISTIEHGLFKHLVCSTYRKFIKMKVLNFPKFAPKKQKQIHPMELIGNALAPIPTNLFFKILKKWRVK